MLTFGVDAGPVPKKVDLQSFCDIITERYEAIVRREGLVRASLRRGTPGEMLRKREESDSDFSNSTPPRFMATVIEAIALA